MPIRMSTHSSTWRLDRRLLAKLLDTFASVDVNPGASLAEYFYASQQGTSSVLPTPSLAHEHVGISDGVYGA